MKEEEKNMKAANRSFQLYFDELIHEHLVEEEPVGDLYDRALLHDTDISVSDYTYNTASWD